MKVILLILLAAGVLAAGYFLGDFVREKFFEDKDGES